MGLRDAIKDHAKQARSKLNKGGELSTDVQDQPIGDDLSPTTTEGTGRRGWHHVSSSISSIGSNSASNDDSNCNGVRSGFRRSIFRNSMGKDKGGTAALVTGTLVSEPEGVPPVGSVDLTIQFVGAKDLPRTDAVGGGSDPYFKASLDGVIDYTSTVQKGTMNPVWNEVWNVKNVPANAELKIKVWDKDESPFEDDYVGSLQLSIEQGGLRESDITGRFGKKHGRFFMNIIANPAYPGTTVPPYTFAGPCRYSRHKSPTVGALTAVETDERLYATWKVFLTGIHDFFGDVHQHWNENYAAAKKIFGRDPVGASIRTTIHGGHKLLYARTTANQFGILNRAGDLIKLFKDETKGNRIKPAVYTYIINDNTWRFSETGAAFFVDFASKHALHANCATEVRYSGEFHWRPMVPGGWGGYDESQTDDSVEWELVIDNNSGTYAPDKAMLPAVKGVIEHNFPGLKVLAIDHGDPALKESTTALRKYAKERRGIRESEFIAHTRLGDQTIHNLAARISRARHRDEE